MCQFKSGIILKNRCVVAPADNDGHSDLLKSLKIEDSYINAVTVFIRAELIPPDDEWWTNPEGWQIHIDQDITPDWFELEKEKYISEFRSAVKEWWKTHVLIDQEIVELNSGYYRLKRCKVKKLCGDVKVLLDSSQVSEMHDSSQVSEMHDSSRVGRMYDSSQVGRMHGSSQVSRMYGSSQVGEMYDSSQVGEMYDSSQVGRMHDSSQVSNMYGSSQVSRMHGSSTVRDFKNWPKIKIIVPEKNADNFEMIVSKNTGKN